MATETSDTFDKPLEKSDLIKKILELQATLTELTLKIESVRGENKQLKEDNVLLKIYASNLVSKMSSLPLTRNRV